LLLHDFGLAVYNVLLVFFATAGIDRIEDAAAATTSDTDEEEKVA